jgi:hypothetical protein
MEIDIDSSELLPLLSPIAQSILALQDQLTAIEMNSKSLEEEINGLKTQLSWQDKHLMGFLGGDRSRVKKINLILSELDKNKIALDDLSEKLKTEKINLDKIIGDHLSQHSPKYQGLLKRRKTDSDLYNASKEFYNFLSEAKGKVDSALSFASWETLLNHPKAKEGLNGFIEQTKRYQRLVTMYETDSAVDLLDGVNLVDLIKFTSEKVALESFYTIASKVKKVFDFTDARLIENRKNRDLMIGLLKR